MRYLRIVIAVLPLWGQDTEHEPKVEKEKDAKPGFQFVWKRHPSLRFGDWLRVDFRARFQSDWQMYEPEVKSTPDLFRFARRRFGIEGTVLREFEYEVSRETAETDYQWKDVYGNWRRFRAVQIRGGRFRIPFSLDQLTGPTQLEFIERSRIADRLAPNRDTGVMLHGPIVEDGPKYQVGYFFNDGDNAADRFNQRTGQATWAGRLTGQPQQFVPWLGPVFETLTIGAAYTTSQLPEGLNSLRGRTVSRETIFPYYFVNGRRQRIGTELEWLPGPFSLKGEYIGVREGRKGQSLRGEDLPDLIHRGFYVSGTWVASGQAKRRRLAQGRMIPFTTREGWGALEFASRYEFIRSGSDGGTGNPSRSTRASRVLGNSERAWTLGANWYLNQWTKMQANFVRERIEDTFRAPIAGRSVFWAYLFRLQLAL
jgi:phosphate-selective porin